MAVALLAQIQIACVSQGSYNEIERERDQLSSDLAALEASSAGKLELEYAGVERDEFEVVREIQKRATKVVFDALIPLEGMAPVLESFENGWKVEVGIAMPSEEYLVGLDEITGLREAAARLSGGDSPARLASAIEFILDGLHLANRLNKVASERGALYAVS